jgi:predicted nuclease of predicted toxin-antitoxin system
MARLLVDEALPRSLVVNLRAAGHRADGIRELGLRGRSDEEVFRQARQLDAVLITSDLDFTNLARFLPRRTKALFSFACRVNFLPLAWSRKSSAVSARSR